MGDRGQLYGDPEEALRAALDGRQANIWTAMPGIVRGVDLAKQTLSVEVAIQGVVQDENGADTFVNITVLPDVPIVWPRAGGFALTFPISEGDEVLVVFASRCMDAWWQSGGVQKPMEARMHDLSDAMAIPGPCSQPRKLSGVSATDVELRDESGDTLISLTAGGKIGFENATVELKDILTDLQSTLNTFMTTLAAFGGGGSPVTQAMLQAPAATAQAALAPILTQIGALLK